jgi:hypothetical protein
VHSSIHHTSVQLRIWLLGTGALCRTLLVMAAQYPGTLEGMLLHALPPAAAEVLLRKLEAGGLGRRVCVAVPHPVAHMFAAPSWLHIAVLSSGALQALCYRSCS